MKKWLAVPAAISGILAVVTHPLLAQEDGGLSATLDISQRFESTSNLGLDVPSNGTTSLATTSLGFNLTSRTSTQRLSLSARGVFREGDFPAGSDISTGFADPRVSLRYARESYNAAFNFSGSFQQTDVDFARSLTDFVNEDGELELPEDFEDLQGTGQRNRFSFSTSLDTGRDAPLGVTFSAGVSGTRYSNVSANSLTDTTRTRLGVTTRLRFNPSTTGRVALKFDRFDDDDALNTQRDTYSINFGVSNTLANATVVDAELGYVNIETRDTNGNETDAGVIGRIGVSRDLLNGSANASIATSRDQAGNRITLQGGRSFDLPSGSLSASLGLTSFEGDSPDVVGSLNWRHVLPSSTLSARINRRVSTNKDDEERIATSATFSFTQQINTVSSVALSADYGLSEDTAASTSTSLTGVTISYNRALTEKWGYNVGVTHRLRDETGVGTADSTSVFFGLNGSIDLLNRR
ncbi:hypothetical protein [Roseovarius aestuariivivens]|uniref:hypothetical protein n=1 Tax=Roseovarius aestuariivivens TaxID=1888910 RepID=UPI00108199FC|nr:hypothetical protein [Roseovarius aestuariivivens]